MSSEAGHTPGPWVAKKDERGLVFAFNIYDRDPDMAGYQEAEKLAPVMDVGEASEANARLIAAAPELLHACKMAEETIGWITDASKERYVTEALRKAIEKAEGGS